MSRLLIVGGNGGLGKAVVSAFKKASWQTLNLDVVENPEADQNIIVDGEAKMSS